MMASRCTQKAVQEFLMERGGRVRQMELIDHFLSISREEDYDDDDDDDDVNNKEEDGPMDGDREVLKRIVDGVGVVQVEDGVKFVCLRGAGGGGGVAVDMGGHGHEECNGNVHETVDYVNCNTEHGEETGASSPLTATLDNNDPSNGNKRSDNPVITGCAGGGRGVEVKLRDRRRRESAPVIGGMPDTGPHSSQQQQARGARRMSRGSQRAMLISCLSEDSALEGLDFIADINTPKGSRRNFIELMMSSSPQVRRSLISRGSRLRDSVRSEGDSTSLLSSNTDDDCTSVTLDPLEHEWMLCASEGLWESLQPLLAVEAALVTKRDFVTGFTCLHWAAKQGKAELITRLMDFAKENGVALNVNVRSGAGYTPLHLAAMHGHIQVVRVLLSDWDADPEARDYSGRRAIQYLAPPLATHLHQEGLVTSPGAEPDSENTTQNSGSGSGGGGRGWRFSRVLQGNLNPLRLLNLPSEAAENAAAVGRTKGGLQRKSSLSRLNARLHRGRHRAQIIHSTSFRDTAEVDLPTSPMRTRPLSNLFG